MIMDLPLKKPEPVVVKPLANDEWQANKSTHLGNPGGHANAMWHKNLRRGQ
jgi:hypothetical protein